MFCQFAIFDYPDQSDIYNQMSIDNCIVHTHNNDLTIWMCV